MTNLLIGVLDCGTVLLKQGLAFRL